MVRDGYETFTAMSDDAPQRPDDLVELNFTARRGEEVSKSPQRGAAYTTTLDPLDPFNTCAIREHEPTQRELRPGLAPGTTNGPLG